MFKKKKQSNVPGIVVNGQQTEGQSTSQKPAGTSQRLPGKKPLKIAGMLFIAAVVLAAGGLLYQKTNSPSDHSHGDQDPPLSPAEQAALDAGSEYNPETGDGYEAAIAVLDDKLKEVGNDKDQQWQLNLNKVSVYMNANQHQQALEAAQQAEKLDPNFASSAAIADAQKALGNNAEAAKYYQITLNRLKAFKYHNQTDVEFYEMKLKEVQ